MGRREAVQPEHPLTAPCQVAGDCTAHGAQTDDDDVERESHFVRPRICANFREWSVSFYAPGFAFFADLLWVFTSRFHSSLPSAPKLIRTPTSSPVAFR